MKIMLADDEQSMQTLVQHIIEEEGFGFVSVFDGAAVINAVAEEKPDLLILDVMMPRLDGFEVCRRLRDDGQLLPIIILSAKGDIVDKNSGFMAGADDYIVKPFSPEELLMRIKAHIRHHDRITTTQPKVLVVGDIQIDLSKHRVTLREKQIELTYKEFLILTCLAQNKGEIVSREQIIEEVWGREYVSETQSISFFVHKIREKIEDDPSHPVRLTTVRNVGYRLGA
jgi:two-component system response regulator VicR